MVVMGTTENTVELKVKVKITVMTAATQQTESTRETFGRVEEIGSPNVIRIVTIKESVPRLISGVEVMMTVNVAERGLRRKPVKETQIDSDFRIKARCKPGLYFVEVCYQQLHYCNLVVSCCFWKRRFSPTTWVVLSIKSEKMFNFEKY